MRKFQIIPIAHSLKGNKLAEAGDIVSESQLTGPADELISAGFIKEVFENEEVAPEEEESEEIVPDEIEPVAEEVAPEISAKDIKKFNKK
jgi:hypothetical protein